MQNYIQSGEVITLAAPYDVASGAGLLVGTIVGIATGAALSGTPVEVKLEGVVDVAKVSAQAWTAGATIYWDDTAKNFTTTSTSNTKVGVAVQAAANPSAIGRIRLNGSF
jgi:predicted RecA/RadA family phage recombinase